MSGDNVRKGPWTENGPSEGREQNPPTGGGGVDGAGPPTDGARMNERIAKVEGQIESLRLIATVIVAVMLGGFAFLGVQIARVDSRLSALSDRTDARFSALSEKVDALPGRISGDLTDLTRTLAASITAARQVPPQVLLVPAPALRQEAAPTAPAPRN